MTVAVHDALTAIESLINEGLSHENNQLDITVDKLAETKSEISGDEVARMLVTTAQALNSGEFSKAWDHISMIKGLIDPAIERGNVRDSCPYYSLFRLISKLDTGSVGIGSLSPHTFVDVGNLDTATYVHILFDDSDCTDRRYVELADKYRQGVIVMGTQSMLIDFEDWLVEFSDDEESEEW